MWVATRCRAWLEDAPMGGGGQALAGRPLERRAAEVVLGHAGSQPASQSGTISAAVSGATRATHDAPVRPRG
jgi:hypothetical protein